MNGLLLDENLPDFLAEAIHAVDETIPVHFVGDGIAPPKGTPDLEILDWIELHNYVFVTNNRKSMPVHIAEHVDAGRHVPGLLQVPEVYGISDLAEHLALRFGASIVKELHDCITHIHL